MFLRTLHNLERTARIEIFKIAPPSRDHVATISLLSPQCMTYDSAVEDAFNIHVALGKTIKFARNKSKLYVYKPKKHLLHHDSSCEHS